MIKRAAGSAISSVDVVVIGAGHSGLAMSHCLTARSIDHVILERGAVANTWRHERWDSLRLLTPNWLSRLPGYRYTGSDPDGFMNMDDVIEFLSGYAKLSGAPVNTNTTVTSVQACGDRYQINTDRGQWLCRSVVIASGAFNLPAVPSIASAMPERIVHLTPNRYRSPAQLEPGGVLVVGASATGLQLADEIQRAGRQVTIAVGEHVRMPRTYRGHDIQWWMHMTGLHDTRYDAVDDLVRVRNVPSPQLIGSREQPIFDLNALTANGVRLAGKLVGIRDGKAQFSGSLRNVCALADLKMERLLRGIDRWIDASGYPSGGAEREEFAPTDADRAPVISASLTGNEVRTIIWATGFRPDYSWLNLPVLDHKGRIQHDGGVLGLPGVYVMGLPFLRRRKSSFIHGAEDDARDISQHLAGHLDTLSRRKLAGMAA